MNDIKIKGKAIYTTKGAAREYGRVGCNFYTGCPHECAYCYLKRGAPSKQLGGNVVQLKKCFKNEDDALEVFNKEVRKHIDVLRKTGVFFSFTTDPMIPETRWMTMAAIKEAVKLYIPVYILTKDASFVYEEYLMDELDAMITRCHLIHFGFTLTGRDDMEPNASSNLERIKSMQILNKYYFPTWASIEPVIDWISAARMVGQSLGCCDHYKIGLRSGVKKDYYDLADSCIYLDVMTRMITDAGKTVYLKESARAFLRRCYKEDYYNEILSRTVDMDGNQITLPTTD
jgi:DNA repair photolyase